MEYKWNNTGFSANANKVGKELEIIEATKDLTNTNILQYAKMHKSSELNKCFEWDDTIAGEKYRMQQANYILASISIVVTEKEEPVRAFVNVKTDEKKVFKSIVKVLENDEEYQQLLKKAERDFISYKDKYNKLVEIKDLKNIIIKNL